MALDVRAASYGLPQANLAAARQHVQTLSARDREALLRALLEEYEHPHKEAHPSRSAAPDAVSSSSDKPSSSSLSPALSSSSAYAPERAATTSVSAFSASLSACPPLFEDAREAAPATQQLKATAAAAVTRTATAASNHRRHLPPLPTTAQQALPATDEAARARSPPVSQPLRSSFFHHRQDVSATAHSRSRSLSSTETPAKATANTKRTRRAVSHNAARSAGRPSASTPTATAKSTITTRAYWCTTCGEKLSCRGTWALHDVTCRGAERWAAAGGDSPPSSSPSPSLSSSSSFSSSPSSSPRSSSRTRRHPFRHRQQRAWGCGFCAAFLGSLQRYHDHVMAHFEHGKTLAHWHYPNVVYGLLHQPGGVHKAWKLLWAVRESALPLHLRPKATWAADCCLTKTTAAIDSSGDHGGSSGDDSRVTLQQALEFFDPALDSAAALALQADALAIYIAVPIGDGGEKAKAGGQTAGQTIGQTVGPTAGRGASASEQPTVGSSAGSPPMDLLLASGAPESPSESKQPARAPPRKSLSLFWSKTSPQAAEAAAARESTPSPPKKTTSPLLRLSKFRSPAPPAKSTAAPPASEAASTPAPASTPALENTTAPPRGSWATRPLPPLARTATTLPLSVSVPAPLSTARVTVATTSSSLYSADQPPSPPPKPKRGGPDSAAAAAAGGDWNSIATTIVDEIMAPLSGLRIAV